MGSGGRCEKEKKIDEEKANYFIGGKYELI